MSKSVRKYIVWIALLVCMLVAAVTDVYLRYYSASLDSQAVGYRAEV